MLKRSTLLAVAALVLVMVTSAGTGAVAAKLITGKDVKDNSLTGKDIKNSSLTVADIKGGIPAGPEGPRGATGAQGPQGPAGPAGLPGASPSTVIVQSPAVFIPPGEIGSVDATCPAGKKISGGGFFSGIALPAASAPASGNSTTTWRVVINNTSVITAEVYSWAICI